MRCQLFLQIVEIAQRVRMVRFGELFRPQFEFPTPLHQHRILGAAFVRHSKRFCKRQALVKRCLFFRHKGVSRLPACRTTSAGSRALMHKSVTGVSLVCAVGPNAGWVVLLLDDMPLRNSAIYIAGAFTGVLTGATTNDRRAMRRWWWNRSGLQHRHHRLRSRVAVTSSGCSVSRRAGHLQGPPRPNRALLHAKSRSYL